MGLDITFYNKKRNLVIFIHGLFGSKKTWENKEGKSILELLYTDEIKENFDFGVFIYKTNIVKKYFFLKKDQLNIEENSELLASEINIKGIDYENIILVGHSMGGLIAKQYLLANLEMNKISAYVSIATPHLGSKLAKLNSFFYAHEQIEELIYNNDYLKNLNNQWISSQNKLPTSYYFYGAFDKIVEKDSAIPFVDAKNVFAFSEDHTSIVKVQKQNSIILNLKNILQTFIKENNPEKILMINNSKDELDISSKKSEIEKDKYYIFYSMSESEKEKIFQVSNTKVLKLKSISQLEQFIKDYVKRIREKTSKAKEIVYTGIPLLPLAFLDGYNTKKINKKEYIINFRNEGLKKAEYGKIKQENLNSSNLEELRNNEEEVTIIFFYSFKIEEGTIENIYKNIPILYFNIEVPKIDGITHYSQIEYISNKFLKYVRQLKSKGIKKIHLFCAIPVPLAFEIGRGLETHDPTIIIYNYNSDNYYDWGLELKTNKIILL